LADEFADFIEEDEMSDDDERQRMLEEREIARPRDKAARGVVIAGEVAGLDEDALDEMKQAFGDGEDYGWALAMEEEADEREQEDQHLELKDVFEPSQLVEKMLTDADNLIRATDEPERFQIARRPYKHVILTDEQFKEEAKWIGDLLLPKKPQLSGGEMPDVFRRAVAKVLEFFITDEVEVPYVFQHRKDHLIHAVRQVMSPRDDDDWNGPEKPQYRVDAVKLLNQTDLWDILDLDLQFRALVDKRNALQRTYDNLASVMDIQDDCFESMLVKAATIEELSDIQEYLQFTYSAQLKDMAVMPRDNENGGDAEGRKQRRPGTQKSVFERIRNGRVYNMVRAFGISADHFAQNCLSQTRRQYTDDPSVHPEEHADELIESPDFNTGEKVLKAAKAMYAEEIFMNPRMRSNYRRFLYMTGVFQCHRTDKGLRKIDEQHPYYELKYLRNLGLADIARNPELYLRMLKAEQEGLVEVKITTERPESYKNFVKGLYDMLESDNFSEVADAWNRERREVLDTALAKLDKQLQLGVKANMKRECESAVSKLLREEYTQHLDQAPYQPRGMVLGTPPRVLALSAGQGQPGKDAICWAFVEDDGRVLENGKFGALSTEERDFENRQNFVELVQRRKPDVIGMAGFSVETHRLFDNIQQIVDQENLQGAEFEDDDNPDDTRSERLDVIMVRDDVARLYHNSTRSQVDLPSVPPLTRYCVALARYMQSPLKEYAALGKDIVSIQFHPGQNLLPISMQMKVLETAMVDMVNMCGLDINEAVSNPYNANLLPYICGLGPRKATQVIKAINANVSDNRASLPYAH
jgi:transcription elongation factor SPT6